MDGWEWAVRGARHIGRRGRGCDSAQYRLVLEEVSNANSKIIQTTDIDIYIKTGCNEMEEKYIKM